MTRQSGVSLCGVARYAGSPGRAVGELPECSQDMMIDFTKSYYQHFTPVKEYAGQ